MDTITSCKYASDKLGRQWVWIRIRIRIRAGTGWRVAGSRVQDQKRGTERVDIKKYLRST